MRDAPPTDDLRKELLATAREQLRTHLQTVAESDADGRAVAEVQAFLDRLEARQ